MSNLFEPNANAFTGLLKQHGGSLSASKILPDSMRIVTVNHPPKSKLLGMSSDRSESMLVLWFAMVLLLHVLGIFWFLQPTDNDEVTPAKPLLMDVSMIAVSAPKQVDTAPPQPPKKIILPEKKTEPKKIPDKPPVKKAPVSVQKPVESTPTAPNEPVVANQSAPEAASPTSSNPVISESKPALEENLPVIEADYKASYLHNPKPEYPSIARSREWVGLVKLHVLISAQGLSEKVELKESSGHDILDEAAIEAVKNWRFVPAKRGQTAIAHWQIVPINFKLDD